MIPSEIILYCANYLLPVFNQKIIIRLYVGHGMLLYSTNSIVLLFVQPGVFLYMFKSINLNLSNIRPNTMFSSNKYELQSRKDPLLQWTANHTQIWYTIKQPLFADHPLIPTPFGLHRRMVTHDRFYHTCVDFSQ